MMNMRHWRAYIRFLSRSGRVESRAGRPVRCRPRLEALECRTVPAVITVTTASDDSTANNGIVSLREAIAAINAGSTVDPDILRQNPGAFGSNDTINFNIAGAGTVKTIAIGSLGKGALPALLKPVSVNGYSQPGASANTLTNGDNAQILIELNGASAGTGANGIQLGSGSGGSTVSGLAINRFNGNGIEIQSNSNFVTGNFVGTNPQGAAASPNQGDGIRIDNASSNTIGGLALAARNLVSGNLADGVRIVGAVTAPAGGNKVVGNFVGVNATGVGSVGAKTSGSFAGTASGNGLFGVEISGGTQTTVGGGVDAGRNVIGFNAMGIGLDNGAQNNVILDNNIGVGADGATPVGNNMQGIVLRSTGSTSAFGNGQALEPAVSGNLIGMSPKPPFAGLGNIIAFNGGAGIAIFGNPPQNNVVQAQNGGNSILGNSIYKNGRNSTAAAPAVGIDLSNKSPFPTEDGFTANDSGGHGAANDPNNFQNSPIITSVTETAAGLKIVGTFSEAAEPNTALRVEIYANDPDPLGLPAEGQIGIGLATPTTDASGKASFSLLLNYPATAGQIFTATATTQSADPSVPAGSVSIYNTSEYSPGVVLRAVSADPTAFPIVANGTATVVNLTTGGGVVSTSTPIPGFAGDVHRATGDLNSDGIADTVFAAGPGSIGPRVRVLAGGTGAVLADFYAFAQTFAGGATVAVGDVNGDGVPDLIVGAGPGGGPEVKVIDGTKLSQIQTGGQVPASALLADFFAYAPSFVGGVNLAAGDVNGDGHADVITGAAGGGGPHVKVIDGTKVNQMQADGQIANTALLGSFFAYSPTFVGGVYVAAGDVNGDGRADVILGAGAGGGPEVKVVDGTKLNMMQSDGQIAPGALLSDFFAYAPSFAGGIRVDAVDVNGDGKADIITGAGPGGGPHVKVVDATKGLLFDSNGVILDTSLLAQFFVTDQTFLGGVWV
jgi:hypothetical protein